MKLILSVSCLLLAQFARAQTVEEVGDADSFGRDVTYLGVATSDPIYFKADCTAEIAAGFECTPPLPAPAVTQFAYTDLDSIQLPARASNSLLCFAMTPLVNRRFRNDLPNAQTAALITSATLTIESPVLDNAALINPQTGLPFGGKLDIVIGTHNESRRLAPGDFDNEVKQLSRACQGALISKRALMGGFGLTQSQANSVFNNRMTVRLGVNGTMSLVNSLVHMVGIRLYGDRR